MRINKIQLVGLAAALAGGVAAPDADATDRTISTATTTPVTTSQPEPPSNTTPGDVTVAAGGSITVTATQTAVTIDSSNDVTNAGSLSSNDANGTRGVVLLGGNTGSVSNTGTVSLLESYTLADSDSDGNFDGVWAQGTNRHGILLSSGPFTGDITNSGTITVEGNASSGISLLALLNGDLNSTGTINVTGDNSSAVAISGGAGNGVNGNVRVAGLVNVRGAGSTGLAVDAPITGSLRINGSWSVSGYFNTTAPASTTNLDADDLQIGGPAIAIRSDVANGVIIEGVGVEDDEDDDGDGLLETNTAETNDDASAVVASFGSAPALLVQATPASNLLIGAASSGYGLHVRGTLVSSGVYNGITATAVRVEGSATTSTTVAGGASVDGVVRATAYDANAYGFVVGANASLPQMQVRRELSSTTISDLARTAYGVVFETNANVPLLSNSGTMRANLFGETGDAVVILDQSNSLATINNSGSIRAVVSSTDADPNDGIPAPPATGSAVAVDVSASTIGVTLNQNADVVFLDDDTTDNDATSRPAVEIVGDIRFGSGADVFNLLAGAVLGDVTFGNGADSFVINNGATFAGGLTDSDGQLNINVVNGSLTHSGGALNLTSATFGANSTLQVTLSQTPGQSTFFNASGAVSFAAGAELIPIVPAGLPASGAQTFLTAAGGLSGASNVTGVVANSNAPYLYTLSVNTVSGDPNSLEAAYIMRTPAQLGLNANQTAAFTSLIDALRLDSDAAAAFSALQQTEFFEAYTDLMPSYASAATELAATAIQQSQSATTNRLAHTRLHGLDEVSAWAQEIGYAVDRTPPTANGQQFNGNGFGIAVGIDGPLNNGALFGLSGSFLASQASDDSRTDGEISTWLTEANAYLGTAMGPIDLDFVAGAGVGKMQSRRTVVIGTGFAAETEADWWTYEGHGAVRASVPMSLSNWLVVTPQAALTYVYMNEQGYEESGGGVAIDMEAESATSQRLWADAGIEVSTRWELGGNGFIAPRLYAGYRSNAIDEGAERTFRFVSGASDFTLTDEPLGSGGPVIGLGIDGTNGYSTLSLSYEGEFGDQIERHSLNAAVRFRF